MDAEEFTEEPLTAKQRLAISRYAITRHMSRGRLLRDDDAADETDEIEAAADPGLAHGGAWGKIKFLARSWWRHHPINYALQVVRPSIDDYATQQPFKLIGVAAAVGAAAVVILPWRVLPLSVVALAPLKSSGFTAAAVALFAPPASE